MAPPRKPMPRQARPAEDSALKEWAMLLFQSLGVGMMAVILVLALVLLMVGIYVQLIWPLTDWDLGSVSIEQYSSMATAVLSLVFVFGFGAGYWFISGEAWKAGKPKPGMPQKAVVRSRR